MNRSMGVGRGKEFIHNVVSLSPHHQEGVRTEADEADFSMALRMQAMAR